MLDFSYNLDSVFSHELCKSAFSDGIFWDSGVEPLNDVCLGLTAKSHQVQMIASTHWRTCDQGFGKASLIEYPLCFQLLHIVPSIAAAPLGQTRIVCRAINQKQILIVRYLILMIKGEETEKRPLLGSGQEEQGRYHG